MSRYNSVAQSKTSLWPTGWETLNNRFKMTKIRLSIMDMAKCLELLFAPADKSKKGCRALNTPRCMPCIKHVLLHRTLHDNQYFAFRKVNRTFSKTRLYERFQLGAQGFLHFLFQRAKPHCGGVVGGQWRDPQSIFESPEDASDFQPEVEKREFKSWNFKQPFQDRWLELILWQTISSLALRKPKHHDKWTKC